jgi:tRNA(Leu) C34 or U34 (ribose-2'-O)-methylase TrmL
MIAKNKFIKLNVKQKIYKLAETVRSAEKKLKTGNPASLEVLHIYLQYLEPERTHPKISRAFEIIDNRLSGWDTVPDDSQKVRALNFCFHNLLELIDEAVGEKFYDVKRFDNERDAVRLDTAAILDNIRSPFNVGNIFRSADCFGTGELALCGITPKPPSMKIERTAMGTVDYVKWRYFENTRDAIGHYRDRGYRIIALETASDAKEFSLLKEFSKTAFVFGNEEFGITDDILSICDCVSKIRLAGKKNSLNVSNSFAVVMFRVLSEVSD